MTALGSLLGLIDRYGYLIVFLGVMMESAGVPLPGETVLLLSGALAHQGVLDFVPVLVVGALGAVIGDQLGYWAGRLGGRPSVLRWGRYILITPERLERAEAFFDRYGGRAVFLARFVSGLRIFGALVAGTSRMPWGRFIFFNALGASVWVAAAVSVGYFLWASISLVEHWAGRISLSLIAVLALVLLLRRVYRKVLRGGSGEASPGPGDGSS